MDEKTPRPSNVEKAEAKKALTTRRKKKLFLEALSKRLLNVSAACKVVGISRNTVYRWKDEDDSFKKEWDNISEEFFDNIETAMFSKATVEKDTTMLIWLSKTKMKSRGYVEKTETDLTVNPFLELMKAATSEEGTKGGAKK